MTARDSSIHPLLSKSAAMDGRGLVPAIKGDRDPERD